MQAFPFYYKYFFSSNSNNQSAGYYEIVSKFAYKKVRILIEKFDLWLVLWLFQSFNYALNQPFKKEPRKIRRLFSISSFNDNLAMRNK